MLKKSIWFVLYMVAMTVLAVSLLIGVKSWDSLNFSIDAVTENADYEHSVYMLNDLRNEAQDIWMIYDSKVILDEEGTTDTLKYNLLRLLTEMGYTLEEIYEVLTYEFSREELLKLAGNLGMTETELYVILEQGNVQEEGLTDSGNSRKGVPYAEASDASSAAYIEADFGYAPDSTNLRYTITCNDEFLDSNLPVEDADCYGGNAYVEERDGLELKIFLNTEYPAADYFSQMSQRYNSFQNIKWVLIIAAGVSLIMAVVSLIMLSCITGRKSRSGEIELSWLDAPPVEIALVFWSAVAAGVAMVTVFFANEAYCYDSAVSLVLFALAVLVGSALSMTGYLSLVRRIKKRVLLRNSLCYKVGSGITSLVKNLLTISSVSQKVLLGFCGYFFIMIILAVVDGQIARWLMLIISLVGFHIVYRDAVSRQRILEAAEKITAGELDYQIDVSEINHLQMGVALSINQVGNGIQTAVQKSIKDERLRTDLITNVSHDIKTPLTSIINYVDLLKREDIQNEKANGYLEILDQKSQRLKQLTEDLVEASKLSSGNVILNMEKMDFNEILQQALGEFEEKFQSRNLEVVLKRPEGRVAVLGEGRRIWRVLENLFQNVYKYAMPGTRVFVLLEKGENDMTFTLKNISEHSLNIESDELTERFIRGDVSRTTEGSGLGLSIAKDLTILQKGSFVIQLDGDLFKVTLKFALIE